jgi:hypothetical protein
VASTDDVCDWLAIDGPSTYRVLEGAHGWPVHAQLAIYEQLLATHAEYVRQHDFGVESRGLTAGGGDRGDGTIKRVVCWSAEHK